MLAFTFPGQGSQRPGMGLPWRDHESWELIDEASDIAGRDIGALLGDADADELKDTRNAQLTTFVSSLMVLDAVERLGIAPCYCAGHSLGEYTALTATGAHGFDDGIRHVCERSAAMHDAGLAQPGTMAAVLGLDDDTSGTGTHILGAVGVGLIVWSWLVAPLSARAINRRLDAGSLGLDVGPRFEIVRAGKGIDLSLFRIGF